MATHKNTAVPGRPSLQHHEPYHRNGLRDHLIATGIAMLDEGDSSALSLREVARRVGVSQTAPGHHFGDRAGLLAAISARGFIELTARRHDQLAGSRDAEPRLRIAMLAYVEFAVARPALFHLMFGPEIPDKNLYPELRDASLASFNLLTALVAAYLESQHIDASPGSVAFSVWSAAHGLATLLIDQQQVPDFVERKNVSARCEALADLLIAGLRSGSSAGQNAGSRWAERKAEESLK